MVSHDSVAIDGETSVQHRERETRNADRQRRHNEEAEDAIQAGRGDPPPLARNLQQEFLMVDNQQVEQTPSASLAMATHELARLPLTLEVLKIQALLKAAQVQVNNIQNLALSFSTAFARSRNPCSFRRDGGSRYHSGQIVQGGPRGNVAINPESQGPQNQHGRPARNANQEVNQPLRGDARDRINTNLDAHNRIENSHAQRHQAELQRQ